MVRCVVSSVPGRWSGHHITAWCLVSGVITRQYWGTLHTWQQALLSNTAPGSGGDVSFWDYPPTSTIFKGSTNIFTSFAHDRVIFRILGPALSNTFDWSRTDCGVIILLAVTLICSDTNELSEAIFILTNSIYNIAPLQHYITLYNIIMHVLSFITILVQCPRCPLLVTASWEVDTILMTLNHNFKHLELVSMTHFSVHFYTRSCSPSIL